MENSSESKKTRLGILFTSNPSWMGGVIYIINLVKVLNQIGEKDKPEIFLIHTPELKKYLNEFEYSNIKFVERTFPSVVKGYLLSWLKRKNMFIDDIIEEYNLDIIFPAKDYPVKSKTKAKVVAWFADLQHKFYPEFFKRGALLYRELQVKSLLRNSDYLVVSSQAVKDDFMNLYKIRKGFNFHIYHFVSITNGFEDVKFEDLKEKYRLPDKYFLVSNQFHKHKNHKVVLLALAKLKSKGIVKHVAMTGKFPDATDSPYVAELHDIINRYELSDYISFLGVLPRKDQLQLMNNAQAIIQPSLFEGWSTVNEDAISLQVPVIAANLPVNIEQLEESGTYFNPHDAEELSLLLSNYEARDFTKKYYEEYSERIRKSVNLLNKILVN